MEESWNIHGVDFYRSFFNEYITNTDEFDKSYDLINNLCYNFQHLEFLTTILQKELYIIVRNQTIKTFIIVGGGIIESLLTYFLISKKIHPKSEWEITKKTHSDTKKVGEETIRTSTTTYRKKESFELSQQKFDNIIQIVEKNNLIESSEEFYSNLHEVKNLRNKVHLTNIEHYRDHDWNNFNSKKYYLVTKTLREILKSKFFNCNIDFLTEKFEFLTFPIYSHGIQN